MKFRAVSNTDLLVSEVSLALDGDTGASGAASIECLLRLAYDEGINLFLVSEPRRLDGAIGEAFGEERRSKISIAVRQRWTGDFDDFSRCLDEKLREPGIGRADILVVDGARQADLHSGALGDAVHRLRAAGRVGHVGLGRFDEVGADASLIHRNGFGLIEPTGWLRRGADDRGLAVLVSAPRFPMRGDGALAFLWHDTDRTAGQVGVQLALATGPGVCSTFISPRGTAELKELARAPLAPPLLSDEIAIVQKALLDPAVAAAIAANHPALPMDDQPMNREAAGKPVSA